MLLTITPFIAEGVANDWQKAVDDASAVGLKYMVCAYLSVEERGTLDHYKQLADIFNKAAETCKKSGIQFCRWEGTAS